MNGKTEIAQWHDRIGARSAPNATPPNHATLSEVTVARSSIRNCRACGKRFSVTKENPGRVFCSVPCRFWSKVDKSSGVGCWPWTRYTSAGGYGLFEIDGKPERSHRVAWRLENGDIPGGLYVLHKCDNRSCCNPSHLFLGTHQDNVDDMMAKGRLTVNWNNLRQRQQKGLKHSQESLERMRISHANITDETRAKLSAGIKASWARRKAAK